MEECGWTLFNTCPLFFQVSNIQARAVVLSWAPPVGLPCGPHGGLSFPYSYEVALSDKGRDGKYKIIYR